MTSVTFVLPGASPMPAGGPKMVFRYANALAAAGWKVSVVMPAALKAAPHWRRILRMGRYWIWSITQGYSPRAWLPLHQGVSLLWVPDLDARRAIGGDAVIATAVQTAEAIAQWPNSSGRKYYFVQGYETWDFPPERITASWRLPLRKIAVSQWLCDLILAAGESADYLPNGLDHDAFGLDRPPEQRRQPIVLWPHHHLASKGSADVLEALKGLDAGTADMEIFSFGTAVAPRGGGLRISYCRNPSQPELRALYNRATVMVAPSHSEGWGLPACEAIQCGCALAASDIGGHREFMQHGRNALLHPPGDVAQLRENVRRLIADQSLRLRLVRQAVLDVAQFRFEPAVDRLKRILQNMNLV